MRVYHGTTMIVEHPLVNVELRMAYLVDDIVMEVKKCSRPFSS